MKIVIIGGVAGGASAAARARRLSEEAEIVIFERGHHPSFANCGLPYYVGGKIESRDKLLVAPVEMLRRRYRLDVRTRTEVTKIDRDQKIVHVNDLESGEVASEAYDKLIIATGASPFRPPLPGIDSSRVLQLRDLSDADQMHQVVTSGAKRAVIIGAGFIGIEVAENLVRRGIETWLIQLDKQILSPWDEEMVSPVAEHIQQQGVKLRLKDTATALKETDSGLKVSLQSGDTLEVDFAVVCIGVRPENQLATDADIACGQRGGIVVNDSMQTSDSDIYAVGDVAQVECFITKKPIQVPLAGPANRQGRIAADHIFGRSSTYRGTQGTAIVAAFSMTVAMTGLSEKRLRAEGIRYEKIYIHPSDHAGYYPGAQPMTLKLLFDPESGKILGAQCVGSSGVDKRIDVIAVAIQAGMTVEDLEEVELCYAPQYGHAKDPINMAGFVASGVRRHDQPVAHWTSPNREQSAFLLDVRTKAEFEAGHVPGATNIPLEELRERLDELPRNQEMKAYCMVGQRGYLATRLLIQNGFDVANLSGGFKSWSLTDPQP